MDANDELQMSVARADIASLETDEAIERSMSVLRNETLYCDSYLD
jgi:hypothetical protein